jgi:DNA-binding response OmpR family regulator
MICTAPTRHQPAHVNWNPWITDASHVRILVADDEPHLLHLVQTQLERAGLDVIVARDGEEALACVREARPDLCLLDVAMPKRTGLEVLQVLRGDGDTVSTKVIMLSARAGNADIELGFALGADGYITKPFSLREVVACVRAHLHTC